MNQYRDGADHIGLHKDKVKDFVPSTSVFTVSLGTTRLFRLKHCTTGEIQDILLAPGSLFVLGTITNSEWKHSIVKKSVNEVKDVRISLTFRSIGTRYFPSNDEDSRVVVAEYQNSRNGNDSNNNNNNNNNNKNEEDEEEDERTNTSTTNSKNHNKSSHKRKAE